MSKHTDKIGIDRIDSNFLKIYDPDNKEMEILEEIREEGRKKETKPKDDN